MKFSDFRSKNKGGGGGGGGFQKIPRTFTLFEIPP
jgi:hypothetical protein